MASLAGPGDLREMVGERESARLPFEETEQCVVREEDLKRVAVVDEQTDREMLDELLDEAKVGVPRSWLRLRHWTGWR